MFLILALLVLLIAFLLALKSARDEIKKEQSLFAPKENGKTQEPSISPKEEEEHPQIQNREAQKKISELKEKLLEGEFQLPEKGEEGS